MKSILIRLGVFVAFFLIVILWCVIPDRFFMDSYDVTIAVQTEAQKPEERHEEIAQEKTIMPEKEEREEVEKPVTISEAVKQSVPFTVQAPHAQWDDPRYQDACEEASMVMAHAWIVGSGNISKNDAEKEMESLFAFESEKLGEGIDASASDVAQIFREYYKHDAELHTEVGMEDLYNFLAKDAIVIAPTNGKMLENPNFSNGGPERHMVVIIGYDRKNKEFITNDPGTRLGRGYKYKDSTLYNAIRDYDTGAKEKVSGTSKKVIVIKK